jgi:hypothetical protein
MSPSLVRLSVVGTVCSRNVGHGADVKREIGDAVVVALVALALYCAKKYTREVGHGEREHILVDYQTHAPNFSGRFAKTG